MPPKPEINSSVEQPSEQSVSRARLWLYAVVLSVVGAGVYGAYVHFSEPEILRVWRPGETQPEAGPQVDSAAKAEGS